MSNQSLIVGNTAPNWKTRELTSYPAKVDALCLLLTRYVQQRNQNEQISKMLYESGSNGAPQLAQPYLPRHQLGFELAREMMEGRDQEHVEVVSASCDVRVRIVQINLNTRLDEIISEEQMKNMKRDYAQTFAQSPPGSLKDKIEREEKLIGYTRFLTNNARIFLDNFGRVVNEYGELFGGVSLQSAIKINLAEAGRINESKIRPRDFRGNADFVRGFGRVIEGTGLALPTNKKRLKR